MAITKPILLDETGKQMYNALQRIAGAMDGSAVVVEDSDSTTYSVAVADGQTSAKTYVLGELTELNITSVGSSVYETNIFFGAGEGGCEVAITKPYDVVGSIDTSSEGKYVISILNGVVVCAAISTETETETTNE